MVMPDVLNYLLGVAHGQGRTFPAQLAKLEFHLRGLRLAEVGHQQHYHRWLLLEFCEASG